MSGTRRVPPPRRMSVMRGVCVHGKRYEGCPLDMIEAGSAPSIFRRIVGWIAVLLFLAWLFG